MTLASIYQEEDTRELTARATVAGVTFDVDPSEISYSFAFGTVPTATFRIAASQLGPHIVELAEVGLFLGFNGLSVAVFTGQIESVTRVASGAVLECSGKSRKLEVPFKAAVIDLNGVDANVAVTDILDDAGVTYYVVDLPLWDIGLDIPQSLTFQTFGEAINKISQVDGAPWFEMPDGQIRVEARDPIPGPSVYREYFTNELSGPLSTVPAIVTNQNARPRIRDITQRKLLRDVKNRVIIQGAVPEETGDQITATAFASSPWVTTPPQYNDYIFANELIDTEAKAVTVAIRYLTLLNRLAEEVTLPIDGDPEIFLGATVKVIDPAYTGVVASYFVTGYQTQANAGSFVTTLHLRGGVASGFTPQVNPFAAFNWITDVNQVKLNQIVPAGVAGGARAVLVTFDGGASRDFDGTIEDWAWSDDQGNTGNGRVISFAYADSVNTVLMTLTVTDNDGNTDDVTRSVPVPDSDSDPQTMVQIFAAAEDFAMGSFDGGETWNDHSLIGRTFLAVAGGFFQTDPDANYFITTPYSSTRDVLTQYSAYLVHTAADNSFAIAVQAEDDFFSGGGFGPGGGFLGTGIPSSVMLWPMRHMETAFFYAANLGNVGIVGVKTTAEPTTNELNVPLTTFPTPVYKLAERFQHIFAFGGDTANPNSLIRYLSRVYAETFRQQFYNSPDGLTPPYSYNFGAVPPSGSWAFTTIPPGSPLRTAVDLAGPGHHIVDAVWDGLNLTIIFDSGVEPRVWVGTLPGFPIYNVEGFTWQPATGLPAGVDGVSVGRGQTFAFTSGLVVGAPGTLVILDDLTSYYAEDGIAFSAAGNAPSQIAHIAAETADVFLGAASGGIVKTVDRGGAIGYVRPHAGFATLWPAGADGKEIAYVSPPPQAATADLFVLGTTQYARLVRNAWVVQDGGVPTGGAGLTNQLKFYGEGLLAHKDDDNFFRVSEDYGLTWASVAPPAPFDTFSGHARAADGRIWALARDVGPAPDQGGVCYSDDEGGNWTLSDVAFDLTTPLEVACHPTDAMKIAVSYRSTTDKLKVRVTDDRGATWTEFAPDDAKTFTGSKAPLVWVGLNRIIVWARFSDSAVYIYLTTNGGSTWSQRATQAAATVGEWTSGGATGPIFGHISHDGISLDGVIFRSIDQGSTWDQLEIA